jgi:hypothetical protein
MVEKACKMPVIMPMGNRYPAMTSRPRSTFTNPKNLQKPSCKIYGSHGQTSNEGIKEF